MRGFADSLPRLASCCSFRLRVPLKGPSFFSPFSRLDYRHFSSGARVWIRRCLSLEKASGRWLQHDAPLTRKEYGGYWKFLQLPFEFQDMRSLRPYPMLSARLPHLDLWPRGCRRDLRIDLRLILGVLLHGNQERQAPGFMP